MSSAKEKIAMLLSLASSSYEAEAQSALLMARKIMAKHKLRPEDIEPQKENRPLWKSTGIRSTKLSNPWAAQLAGIIAAQHCCRTVLRPIANSRTMEIWLIGFEEDVNLCKLMECYAYDCVMSYCKDLKKKMRSKNTAAEIRQMCSGYGWGFCAGLQAAYDAQTGQNQEWGLVMTVPKEVEDEISALKKDIYAEPYVSSLGSQYVGKGFRDGKAFDPTHRLDSSARK